MLIKKNILFILFLQFISVSAQLNIGSTTFDFGNIEKFNNDTAFFELENNGAKTIYLLPTQPLSEYQILSSKKQILSNEKLTIGIVYYTSQKGNFTLNVPLYFSHLPSPITFTIKGNILSINETAFNTCPAIENSTTLKKNIPLDIVVKDYETNAIIQNASVIAERKRSIINCIPGLGSRIYQCNCDYGKLLIRAKKEGYLEEKLTYDYSKTNHTAIIYLKKPSIDTLKKETTKILEKISKPKEDSIFKPKKSIKDTLISNKRTIETNDTSPQITYYKPNHLVFIIDVSNSMKDSNKLGYLKESIKALINELRANDFITLITYTARQKIIFENINGMRKNELISAIDSLKAGGGSYGADALELGYVLAKKHFITGGNNQLFIATDGIFNGSNLKEEDLYKMVKKQYSKNEIKLSTIAFGTYMPALNFLENLASNGNGQSLKIQTLPQDNDVLIEEVKKQSLAN